MQILHLFFFMLLTSMPALQAGKGGNAKPAGKAGMNPMMGMGMMGGGGGGAAAVQNTATGIDGISSSGKNLNATQVNSMGSVAGSSGLNTTANSDGPQLAANTDFGDDPADDASSTPDAGAYPDDMGIDESAEADIADDAGSAYLQDDDAGDAGEDDQQDAPPPDQQSHGLVANNQTSLDDLIHQQRMLNDQSEQELADDEIFDDSDDEQDDQGDDEE